MVTQNAVFATQFSENRFTPPEHQRLFVFFYTVDIVVFCY